MKQEKQKKKGTIRKFLPYYQKYKGIMAFDMLCRLRDAAAEYYN